MKYCKKKQLEKPNIFYQVKITGVNYEHTCQLSTVFHGESKQKNGTLQPDLNGLNNIISLLCEKPNLKPDLLHPLLLKYIPYYKAIEMPKSFAILDRELFTGSSTTPPLGIS
jgi:hypothetical protein